MSNRRDLIHTLVGVLMTAPGGIGLLPIHAADAVLAAGYRKPREVTTAEELDALPVGSVVRTTEDDRIGHVCVRYTDGWYTTLHGYRVFPLAVTGTVTALHVPGEGDRG